MKQVLIRHLEEIVASMGSVLPAEEVGSSFEIPRDDKFGDLSTNVALKAAKILKKAPRALGEEIASALSEKLKVSGLEGRIKRVAVEGAGFINFYFSDDELCQVLRRIGTERGNFGKPKIKHRKILLEFVSANPTGPLTVAHGRQAALGDSLARILSFCGHEVSKEYYNNDEGVQIQTLGKSLDLRVWEFLSGKEAEIPENYYRGDYLKETAKQFVARKNLTLAAYEKLSEGDRHRECSDFAKNAILGSIQKDLGDFDVTFDRYYSQKELGASGRVEKTLELLKEKKVVYEHEGAFWLRSTDHGDDKDRVLIKSDKTYTYLTPDIAYHDDKFKRGYEELINIWGPDHHGYIARLKGSQAALGHDPAHIRILIAQLVTLYEGKRQVRMSTRAGEFVTLRQILDEVGKDAGRFFFQMRKFEAHLDFDLELAKSQTPENPVFYIQYAHARIESILEQARSQTGKCPDGSLTIESAALLRLNDPLEQKLMKLLYQFQEQILAAERTLEPYRVVEYLQELAGAFHRFYTENRVITEDAALTEARLFLLLGVRHVLKTGLGLLGVSAPVKM